MKAEVNYKIVVLIIGVMFCFVFKNDITKDYIYLFISKLSDDNF